VACEAGKLRQARILPHKYLAFQVAMGADLQQYTVDSFLLRSFPRNQAGKHFKRVDFKMFTELVTSPAKN
jgi:hypothetical protein